MKRFDVTIAGEINLDLILYELPQQMPVDRELLASGFEATLGSSSAIVAHNLAALGARVGFITRTGPDELGAIALERLRAIGVDTSRCTTAPAPAVTGVTILLHHGATRHILTYPGIMAEMSAQHLDEDYLADTRHFHISSLFLQKALQPDLPGLCRRLKQKGITISLDTNDDPDDRWGAPLAELLEIVDLFLPNDDEAMRITGAASVEGALDQLAGKVPLVAIKCGSKGSMVQRGANRWTAPSVPVTAIDSIGAGDSFDAGFLRAFLEGKSPLECAQSGNLTAALSVQRSGGTEAFRDPAFRQAFLNQQR